MYWEEQKDTQNMCYVYQHEAQALRKKVKHYKSLLESVNKYLKSFIIDNNLVNINKLAQELSEILEKES